MSVQTVLVDFAIDAERIIDEMARRDVQRVVTECLTKFFTELKFVNDVQTVDGCLSMFSDRGRTLITVRCFVAGLLTINIEYYKRDDEAPAFTFDLNRELRDTLEKSLDGRGHAYPPLVRSAVNRYFPGSDERILEYDIDKVVFEQRSPFQKVQIVHSKSLGNILVLDELQNISEADLIYTETLMQRGIQKYGGTDICILGGGDGALLFELLKEQPRYVAMLEIDEMVMQACDKHLRSICGDVLERRKGDNYDIIVGDCHVSLDKYIKDGKQFDFVFGDLTDIPISDTPTGEIWDFIRSILEKSFKILKPNGVYLQHGNGSNCPESLRMYEKLLDAMSPKVKYTKTEAFVPSFMEMWVFYQVTFDV